MSDKERGSSKSKRSFKAQEKEPEPQVSWQPARLTVKSWADVDGCQKTNRRRKKTNDEIGKPLPKGRQPNTEKRFQRKIFFRNCRTVDTYAWFRECKRST